MAINPVNIKQVNNLDLNQTNQISTQQNKVVGNNQVNTSVNDSRIGNDTFQANLLKSNIERTISNPVEKSSGLIAQGGSSANLSQKITRTLNAANLTTAQRAKAESIMNRFVSNQSNYQRMGATRRDFLDTYFTGTVISSVKNPNNKVLNNTVEGFAGGKIPIGVSNVQPQSGVLFGTASPEKGVFMNMHQTGGVPAWGNLAQYKFNETLVHEANHFVNDKRVPNPAGNNADRFWNEYRAFVVGRVGAGENPNNLNKRTVLDNLIGANSSYPELRKLYQSDAKLRSVIDKALSGNPNDRFSVNDMRNALVNAGYSSSYITQASNTDNNLNGL
jgi:hypothetical protein